MSLMVKFLALCMLHPDVHFIRVADMRLLSVVKKNLNLEGLRIIMMLPVIMSLKI